MSIIAIMAGDRRVPVRTMSPRELHTLRRALDPGPVPHVAVLWRDGVRVWPPVPIGWEPYETYTRGGPCPENLMGGQA